MAPLINAGDEQCTCWLFPELTGRVFPVQNQVDTDRTEGGPRCHEPPPAEDRPEAHAGARTWPAASTSNRRPTGVNPVVTAATGGPGCGCACPAAGSPVPTTHRTSTPKPTTRKRITPSPGHCRTTRARGGATSMNAPSDLYPQVALDLHVVCHDSAAGDGARRTKSVGEAPSPASGLAILGR